MKKFKTQLDKRQVNVEVADDGSYRVFTVGDCIEITNNLRPDQRKKIEERLPTYLIAVKVGEKILGYFLADDEELVKDPAKAAVFNFMENARVNMKYCQETWDLPPGQVFEIVERG